MAQQAGEEAVERVIGSIKTINHIAMILAMFFTTAYVMIETYQLSVLARVISGFSAKPPGLGEFFNTVAALVAIVLIVAIAANIAIVLGLNSVGKLLDKREFEKARDRELICMVLGFIFSWLVVGIILLIAYAKFDTLIYIEHTRGAKG